MVSVPFALSKPPTSGWQHGDSCCQNILITYQFTIILIFHNVPIKWANVASTERTSSPELSVFLFSCLFMSISRKLISNKHQLIGATLWQYFLHHEIPRNIYQTWQHIWGLEPTTLFRITSFSWQESKVFCLTVNVCPSYEHLAVTVGSQQLWPSYDRVW